MHRNKNIKLIVALALVGVAIVILNFSNSTGNRMGVDKKIFQLSNEQEINAVSIEGKNEFISFNYVNNGWALNDSLRMDQSMRDVFFSVLSSIEIRRPAAKKNQDSLTQFIIENGIRTIVKFGEEIIQDYWVGGNEELEISWAMNSKDQIPYQVHIPGYQSYVAGIYAVPTIDWRSRFIFKSNFALLSRIDFNYPGSNDGFSLVYKDGFFNIPEIDADSSKIANLLDQIAYLQTDAFIDSEDEIEEIRLQDDDVFFRLTLINSNSMNEEIAFFTKKENSRYILGETDDGTFCKFNYKRIKEIFKSAKDFD